MKKMRKNIYTAFFISLLIFVFMCFPNRSHALEPKITDILITNDIENVLFYARLVNGFKLDMELRVMAGIPITFIVWLEVYQERPLRWDKRIMWQEIRRTLKYDNLKKTFNVTTDKAEPVVFSNFESAQKAMSDFNGMIAAPMSSLIKGENYYAMIKIKMDKVRLPLNMEYIFFFVSLWDFETSWYKQRFSY